MEVKSQLNVKEASPYAHALPHYMELCDKHLPFIDVSRGYRIRKQLQNPYIQFKNPFKPLIRSVDLTIIKKTRKTFREVIIYREIYSQCCFRSLPVLPRLSFCDKQ